MLAVEVVLINFKKLTNTKKKTTAGGNYGEKGSLFKKGNKSALIVAIINTIIAIIKGTAYFFTGNVAMFTETMHSIGDALSRLRFYWH